MKRMTSNNTLVPTRNGEAPLLAAQRGRWAVRMRTLQLLTILAVTVHLPAFSADDANTKAGQLAAQVLSEGINSLDPQGILAWVDMPRAVSPKKNVTLAVTIENARAAEPFKVESIDIASSFLKGFEVTSIDPKPSDVDESFGSVTLNYGLSVAPGGKLVVSLELRSKSPGVFVGDVDIWEGDRFLTRAAQCRVSQ